MMYYILRCPHCGFLQMYEHRTGTIKDSYKRCVVCDRRFKLLTMSKRTTTIVYQDLRADAVRERLLELKLKEGKGNVSFW